jgi:glycogen phosphorylase
LNRAKARLRLPSEGATNQAASADNIGERAEKGSPGASEILQQYGVGSTRFAGSPDALYGRHLKFDSIVEPESSDARERYEAAARAMRDILSSRWLRTDETYARDNPKRVYYVSIEFLIGRSLASNVMNLMLGQIFDEHGRQWIEILDEEPDAGLGNRGLGRLAACFLAMATLELPAAADRLDRQVDPGGAHNF